MSMENKTYRQSATTASIVKLEDEEYVATIRNAIIGKVTCEIEAIFPRYDNAVSWVMSFGLSHYAFRELTD